MRKQKEPILIGHCAKCGRAITICDLHAPDKEPSATVRGKVSPAGRQNKKTNPLKEIK